MTGWVIECMIEWTDGWYMVHRMDGKKGCLARVSLSRAYSIDIEISRIARAIHSFLFCLLCCFSSFYIRLCFVIV